jgi:diguanylate cyclase (GGDEF)-like protein
MAVVDMAYAALSLSETGIWRDVANGFYPVVYALFACAAIAASHEEERPVRRSPHPQLHAGRAVLLGAALLMAPTAAALGATSDAPDRVFLPIATIGVALLVLTRFVHEARARERIHAEILHLASHDPLTGLLNRRAFEQRLGDEVAVAACSVLYVDLDRLKWLNDSAGHRAGDRALVEVARRLVDVVREGDVVARLGGDEFAVCCPGLADAVSADLLADRVISALADVHPGITASVGVATANERLSDPDELMVEADAAMYRAKRSGGNTRSRVDPSVAN